MPGISTDTSALGSPEYNALNSAETTPGTAIESSPSVKDLPSASSTASSAAAIESPSGKRVTFVESKLDAVVEEPLASASTDAFKSPELVIRPLDDLISPSRSSKRAGSERQTPRTIFRVIPPPMQLQDLVNRGVDLYVDKSPLKSASKTSSGVASPPRSAEVTASAVSGASPSKEIISATRSALEATPSIASAVTQTPSIAPSSVQATPLKDALGSPGAIAPIPEERRSFSMSRLTRRRLGGGDLSTRSNITPAAFSPLEKEDEEVPKSARRPRFSFRGEDEIKDEKLEAIIDIHPDAQERSKVEPVHLEYHLESLAVVGQDCNYTTVLVRDPRKFTDVGYSLRTKGVELFTVTTMYNESADEVALTLRGVLENLRTITEKTKDESFWKKFAVCIVSDGREKANQKTLEFLHDLGIYDENLVADAVAAHPVDSIGCHLFESTLIFNDDPIAGTEFPPLKILFALKEHNAGKIDSHWWFFEAFSSHLNPKYCFLLDVGTKPRQKAFYHLWRAMERNPQIAGACGEITTRNRANTSFVVSGQHFEYKVAGILDKAMESLFGYISVLPGAFSTYRWTALKGNPLRKYFHHIEHTSAEMTPFEANMYLAEDRILCFELFAKKNCSYTLHFVSDSVAETDVPDNIVSLLKQRRRWLNGSFFASMYAVLNFTRILFESGHSFIRKTAVSFLFLFYLLQLVITMMLVGAFYLTIVFTLDMLFEDKSHPGYVVMNNIFLLTLVLQFVFALSDKPGNLQKLYDMTYVLWGVYFLGVFGFIPYYSVASILAGSWFMGLGFFLSFCIYFFITLLYGEFLSIFTSFIQYLFITPCFMVMFPMYSFCNVHDVSWGTKDLDKVESKPDKIDAQALKDEAERKKKAAAKRAQIENSFNRFRTMIVSVWLLANLIFANVILQFNHGYEFLLGALWIIVLVNGLRFVGSVTYYITKALTRYLETLENQREIDELVKSGKIQPQKRQFGLLNSFGSFLLLPFRLTTWSAVVNVMILSPLTEIAYLIWSIPTVICAMLLYPFKIFTPIVAAIMISWRYIALFEFEIFSSDGRVARFLKIDSAKMHRGTRVIAVPAAFKNSAAYLKDEASYKPLLHVLLVRLLFTLSTFVLSLALFLTSAVFLTSPLLKTEECDGSHETFQFICNSLTYIVDLHIVSSAFFNFPESIILGAYLLLLFFYTVSSIDDTGRQLVSTTLGEPFNPLEVMKKHRKFSSPSRTVKQLAAL